MIGYQADGSYVPCEDCGHTPAPDRDVPGVLVPILPRTPGTTLHRGDCPRVAFLPEVARELHDRLDEMTRRRRRAEAESRYYVIG